MRGDRQTLVRYLRNVRRSMTTLNEKRFALPRQLDGVSIV
jgi:hypothetical protein